MQSQHMLKQGGKAVSLQASQSARSKASPASNIEAKSLLSSRTAHLECVVTNGIQTWSLADVQDTEY